MISQLRFQSIRRIDRAGLLMLVQFVDTQRNMYEWAPAWSDVEKVFLQAIDVERFNKPESNFLNRFSLTAQRVAEGAQRIQNAWKVEGKFTRYDSGELIIDDQRMQHHIRPAFDITIQFLGEWLEQSVDVLVINDMALRLRRFVYSQFGSDPEVYEYPTVEQDALPS